MSGISLIPAELIAAYRATNFRVDAPDQIINLLIDEYNQELASLQLQHHVISSAFITAYNPYSESTSPESNQAAQQALIFHVESLHLPWIPGAGVGANADWAPEPSVLILGITLEQSKTLAQQFRQNAFVFNDQKAIPTLHLCR